ncbi:MAG: hypothetical protein FWC93_04735 [Defluviitaleaceae bacterium]|nr:hypothetical protein [Defluviitaleaceae bacterium]
MINFGIFFVIAASVIFWGVFFVSAISICRQSLGRPNHSTHNFIAENSIHIYVKIVLFGLLVRLATLVLDWFLLLAADGTTLADLFQSFNRWDAPHYLTIAEIGYSWQEDGRNILLVFFPLYPYLIRLATFATGNHLTSACIVSFAS